MEGADSGKSDEFRSFDGPVWALPGTRYSDHGLARVFVSGTQLRDGTLEERCIRLEGLVWEDMLTSDTARDLAGKLLAAADNLDRLNAGESDGTDLP